MKDAIKYGTARELSEQEWCPMSFHQIYRALKTQDIPHWRVGQGRKGYHFPLEVCRDFFSGKPVAAHWMRGEMNITQDDHSVGNIAPQTAAASEPTAEAQPRQ